MNTFFVDTFDTLSKALKKAKRGDTVYIDDNAQIDCTNKGTLELGGDITLASNGARLFSSTTPIIYVTHGCNSISGLSLYPNSPIIP